MRAIVLLSISALSLGCGRVQTVDLTAKLVMSRLPGDWCGSGNPDTIRLDCAFDFGLYVVDTSGKVDVKTCVHMDADKDRTWAKLPLALNSAMAKLEKIPEGEKRFEIAGVEPAADGTCDYDASMANASFSGRSELLMLTGTEVTKRIDINTKCLKAFTAMCVP